MRTSQVVARTKKRVYTGKADSARDLARELDINAWDRMSHANLYKALDERGFVFNSYNYSWEIDVDIDVEILRKFGLSPQ